MVELKALKVNKGAATADRVLVCVRGDEPGKEVPGKGLLVQGEQRRSRVARNPRAEKQRRKGSQVGVAPACVYFLGYVSLVSWKV